MHKHKHERHDDAMDAKLSLRREELDVSKQKVQAGEVILSKEVIEEQKTVVVPVTHEEVVIARRAVDNQLTDTLISSTVEDVIRIPVSEERVNVDKHTVITGEISAYKREVEDMRQIEQTVRREQARVERDGDIEVVNEEHQQLF